VLMFCEDATRVVVGKYTVFLDLGKATNQESTTKVLKYLTVGRNCGVSLLDLASIKQDISSRN